MGDVTPVLGHWPHTMTLADGRVWVPRDDAEKVVAQLHAEQRCHDATAAERDRERERNA